VAKPKPFKILRSDITLMEMGEKLRISISQAKRTKRAFSPGDYIGNQFSESLKVILLEARGVCRCATALLRNTRCDLPGKRGAVSSSTCSNYTASPSIRK
jgi:hypothetical protein